MTEPQAPSATSLFSNRFSNRRIGIAGLAAILGCAACCALPLLAAAGIGGGTAAAFGRVLRPGTELVAGPTVFFAVLGLMAIRRRLRRGSGCGPTCNADGSCCEGTQTASRSGPGR
jgi:hypothetical protein